MLARRGTVTLASAERNGSRDGFKEDAVTYAQSSSWDPKPSVSAISAGSSTTLFDSSTGEFYGMNEEGAFIWAELHGPTATLGSVATALSHRYRIGGELAYESCEQLLQQLIALNLVRRRSD